MTTSIKPGNVFPLLRRERERYDTLYAVRELVQQGNWVVLDVETTSLEQPEMVQWAVAAPDGTILGHGFVRPTRPITERAGDPPDFRCAGRGSPRLRRGVGRAAPAHNKNRSSASLLS
jgi:hypothetical protein